MSMHASINRMGKCFELTVDFTVNLERRPLMILCSHRGWKVQDSGATLGRWAWNVCHEPVSKLRWASPLLHVNCIHILLIVSWDDKCSRETPHKYHIFLPVVKC